MDGTFDMDALNAGFAAAAARAVASLGTGRMLAPESINLVVRVIRVSPDPSLWRLGGPGEGGEAVELTWRPGGPADG